MVDEPHPSLGLGFSAYSDPPKKPPCEHEAEVMRLRGRLDALRIRIEEVDRKAEQRSADEGWVTGYTLPTGPWHRLLAEARK
jgi:hypothetical protein